MLLDPRGRGRMLVCALVIADDMHVQIHGGVLDDLLQEVLELHRTVATVRGSDHGATSNIHRSEQARRRVPKVVKASFLGHTWHHRERPL